MSVPPAGRRAFNAQRLNAHRRGIPFEFTLEEWWSWWQIDGRWERRGRKRGQLVMCRSGDEGAYSAANVYCGTHAENARDRDPHVASETSRRAWAIRKAAGIKHHLEVTGEGHPRSRTVLTPEGRFGSAREAARHFDITPQAAAYRCGKQIKGWCWEGDQDRIRCVL